MVSLTLFRCHVIFYCHLRILLSQVKVGTISGELETLLGARAPLGKINLGENDLKETGVGDLASATNGGTICQAPVSVPAPGPAAVEVEVEGSFEGSAPEAQVILSRSTIPSGVATDDTEATVRALRA